MRRTLIFGVSAALVAASLTGAAVATSHGASPAFAAAKFNVANSPSGGVAGLQHSSGATGWECAEPATTWDEFAGYNKAVRAGARILPYIGHDEAAALFFSNKPGAG